MSSESSLQVDGIRQIRRLLSVEHNPPCGRVISMGILPRLVEFLSSDNAVLQFESAWAITNIASTDYTNAVVESGAIEPLIVNMMSADANVREQSMWCIGNIVGDKAEYRDIVYNTENAINNLMLNIQHPESINFLRNATWTLSNFCRGRPGVSVEQAATILPALAYLITMDDKDVISDALWGICYLTDSDEAHVDAVIAHGAMPRLVELLGHAELVVMLPALRAIGNIISGSEHQTQAAIDAGALAALVPLLHNPRRNVRREACWAVSNAAAGTHAQITQLLNTHGMIDAVVEQVKVGEWNVRKEAAWVLCNVATAGNAEHVCRVVSFRCIEPLVDVLSNDDSRMLCVVMDAMNAILAVEKQLIDSGNPAAALCRFAEQFEEAGGVARLDELQEHSSNDVYEKARNLVDKYFSDGGENSENVEIPVSVPQAKTFGFGTQTSHVASTFAAPHMSQSKMSFSGVAFA